MKEDRSQSLACAACGKTITKDDDRCRECRRRFRAEEPRLCRDGTCWHLDCAS
jgi:predicted amidophosphoribosyltransferase